MIWSMIILYIYIYISIYVYYLLCLFHFQTFQFVKNANAYLKLYSYIYTENDIESDNTVKLTSYNTKHKKIHYHQQSNFLNKKILSKNRHSF